jgi:hypothetical protein
MFTLANVTQNTALLTLLFETAQSGLKSFTFTKSNSWH